MRRSAEPPIGPGIIDNHVEKTPTFEFDLGHLSQTLLAVPAPVVAFKLQLSGRTSKVGNTVRVQLRRNPLSD